MPTETWDTLRKGARLFVIDYLDEIPCPVTDAEIDECFERAADKMHELAKLPQLDRPAHPGFLTSGLLPPQMALYEMTLSYVYITLMRKEPLCIRIHNAVRIVHRDQAEAVLQRYLENHGKV